MEPHLPFDAFLEIALSTTDLIDILNQCRTNKEMARRCDAQFWKTWSLRHTPELYIVIDTPNSTVYDQLFFTPESLYEKLHDIKLLQLRGHIDILLREKKPTPIFAPDMKIEYHYPILRYRAQFYDSFYHVMKINECCLSL